MTKPTKDQCFCKSYIDDSGAIRDYPCGKCSVDLEYIDKKLDEMLEDDGLTYCPTCVCMTKKVCGKCKQDDIQKERERIVGEMFERIKKDIQGIQIEDKDLVCFDTGANAMKKIILSRLSSVEYFNTINNK